MSLFPRGSIKRGEGVFEERSPRGEADRSRIVNVWVSSRMDPYGDAVRCARSRLQVSKAVAESTRAIMRPVYF